MQKIMISVGEASGDLHGASVVRALKKLQPDIRLLGMGGQAMRAEGVDILYDIADISVMGLVEVVKNLPRLFRLKNMLAGVLAAEQPDVLVVIDYPDFNMRLAKEAKKLGIPVVYYISPQVWIWRKGRAKDIGEITEQVAAIFPFEAEVYRQAGARVTFVGHPLLDIVKPSLSKEEAYRHFGADPQRPLVLFMPGSRKQEVEQLTDIMLSAGEKISEELPGCQFFLPVATTISREMLQDKINHAGIQVTLTDKNTYDLMNIADIAIAASGTAILETALMQLPTVVVYKMSPLTYFLGKFLIRIPHVSLPNIIAGREIVPELLQGDANEAKTAERALAILQDDGVRGRMLQDLTDMRRKLGDSGAVQRTAELILQVAHTHAGGHS
ncbi:Lipid-A-disaccharide synthase [Propionispora sp. 2/2-37]|uniref:lipid-A-disaccharide synthase n=1 Tax=Propionispora sp. 2/2-37 TaxID=1677858 RepID=UPI0006BB67A7|nr:lipid-A-disaccharide synthase [Propionispora sp. 2/2-37]CUH94532.1 Lipid-A-disaccharide synthase [Propionispora sp. 2/2-37]